jgi:hypothetical protein
VECGILLLGQTKIEYVSGIVPNEVRDDIREIKSDKINPWLYFTMITVLNEDSLSITVNGSVTVLLHTLCRCRRVQCRAGLGWH